MRSGTRSQRRLARASVMWSDRRRSAGQTSSTLIPADVEGRSEVSVVDTAENQADDQGLHSRCWNRSTDTAQLT